MGRRLHAADFVQNYFQIVVKWSLSFDLPAEGLSGRRFCLKPSIKLTKKGQAAIKFTSQPACAGEWDNDQTKQCFMHPGRKQAACPADSALPIRHDPLGVCGF